MQHCWTTENSKMQLMFMTLFNLVMYFRYFCLDSLLQRQFIPIFN